MDIRKEKVAKQARQNTLHLGDFNASHERTLKTNAKVAANRRLYLDGYAKGYQGIPFESFTDLIENDGKMVQRKDHPGFKAGYNQGFVDRMKKEEGKNSHKTR